MTTQELSQINHDYIAIVAYLMGCLIAYLLAWYSTIRRAIRGKNGADMGYYTTLGLISVGSWLSSCFFIFTAVAELQDRRARKK